MSDTAPAYLEMSDEEFLALPESSFESEAEPAAGADDEAPVGAEKVVAAAQTDANTQDDADDDEAGKADTGEDDPAGDGSDQLDGPAADGDDKTKQPSAKAAEDASPTDAADAPVDYEAFYKKVTGGFKANGKEMKVDSDEDVIRLMQMGANYNRKMAGMKPSLKLLKTLDKAGISEEKLNYLIDLDKKDPAAIARLVKEAGVDPLDMDLAKGDTYTAANHAADDYELALDEVMTEIRDSPHYNAVIDVVATQWDTVSKQEVTNSPQLLKVIHDHMASGVYGVISTELEKERMFGRLSGMSDLQAYKHIGDAIQARKGFDHLFQPEQGQPNPAPVVTDPKKAADEQARKDAKRAASTPKAAPAKDKRSADFNPLALSDEEFAKQFDSKYS